MAPKNEPGPWTITGNGAWRIFVTVFLGVLAFFAVRVIDLPATYATKVEVNQIKSETKSDLSCFREEMTGGFNRLATKIDDINRYLRDNNK